MAMFAPLAMPCACFSTVTAVGAQLTMADWSLGLVICVAIAAQTVLPKAARPAPKGVEPDAAPSADGRAWPAAAARPSDPVERELESTMRPLPLLHALHQAGCLRPAHIAKACLCSRDLLRFAGNGEPETLRDLLRFAELTQVPLDNDSASGVVSALCALDAVQALEVWRRVEQLGYYCPARVLEELLCLSYRHGSVEDQKAIFAKLQEVGLPSVRVYALEIHARGSRGDVGGALSLYELLASTHPSWDRSLAWNSLLVVLVRNARLGRAAELFEQGRHTMRPLPALRAALRAAGVP